MNITSYVELTRAQELTLQGFQNAVVRATLIDSTVVASFATFQAQLIRVKIDPNGVVTKVELDEVLGSDGILSGIG